MGTGITDVIGGPHDFLPLRSDKFQKLCLNTKYHVTSKYHHTPKQAWQTGTSFSVDMACQAYGCSTRQGYGKSLFCFPDPVKKKDLYLTWLANLSLEESFTSTKNKLVCEDHFETSCFEGNLMVILFIFLSTLNIWIYYTITFCIFTFCFYRLWQNKWFFSKIEELRN
jgi:hypothetical protein